MNRTFNLYLAFLLILSIQFCIFHSTSCSPTRFFSEKKVLHSTYNTTCDPTSMSIQCNGGEFICIGEKKDQGVCSQCTNDEQCADYPLFRCLSETISVKVGKTERKLKVKACRRRDLFPVTWRDMVATAVCFGGGALASSSGIGGGGIYVPVLLLVAGYTPQFAVPISTVMIFGASIANVLVLIPKKHPHVNRPIIDYTASLILLPIILCGTTLGILLNVILPNWLILILLMILLLVTSFRTFTKGRELHRKEADVSSHRAVDENLASEVANSINETTPEAQFSPYYAKNPEDTVVLEDDQSKFALNELRKSESSRFPVSIWILLSLAWVVICVLSLLRGSTKVPSVIGVKHCSWQYWTLSAVQYPVLIGFSVFVGLFLHMQYRKKVKLGYAFTEGDIRWTKRNTILLPLMFLTAGITAGLLGIGGGMVTGPLLLELGMHPQVSAATSAFMILFTASSTVAQFVFLGALPLDYSLWYAGFGLASGFLGQFIISLILKKFNKSSWIVFAVAISIGLSAVLMGGVGTYNTVQEIKQGRSMGFRSAC